MPTRGTRTTSMLADRLGYDGAWIGEHFIGADPCSGPDVCLGLLLRCLLRTLVSGGWLFSATDSMAIQPNVSHLRI